MSLSRSEISELQRLVEAWAIPIPESLIEKFNLSLQGHELRSHTWIVERYVKFIAPHAEELGFLDGTQHSEELLTSGLFCFLGQIIFYYSQYGLGLTRERPLTACLELFFDFVLLYLHVDHFLDNNDLAVTHTKGQTLKLMMSLLNKPDPDLAPPKMRGLVVAYRNLLGYGPSVKNALVSLFMTEVIQSQKQTSGQPLTRQELIHITNEKGGMTGKAIQACMGDDPDIEGYKVGACVQYLDDLMDCKSDLKVGIQTLATHDMQTYGHLDRVALETARKIVELDSKFTIFKLLMMEILTYAIGQHPELYSRFIFRRLRNSIHIRYQSGSEMMEIVNSWIRDMMPTKKI